MRRRGIKVIYLTLVSLLLVGTTASFGEASTLTDLLNQKNSLSAQADQYQSAADNKAAEASKLSKQINSLDSDITSTESKISETGSKIDETTQSIESLTSDISVKTDELNQLKEKLNESIKEIYTASSKSDYELLLSGSNFSEIVNQSKYVQSVETQVETAHAKVQEVKSSLESQKSEAEAKKEELSQLQEQQVAYKKSAENQKSQKENLKSMTVAQQQDYEALADKLQSEVSQISAAIYAERQRLLKGSKESLGGSGTGGYPYSCGYIDDWKFYTCQCTSYAAWYWNIMLGKSWTNTRPGSGDAKNWPTLARDQGYSVSSTPRVGAIISWQGSSIASSHGHVAIVEKVNSDGTIDISEYNWIAESYSYRKNVTPSNYGSYSYIY